MRPTCPYCARRVPALVPITADTAGIVIDACCRKCEAELQAHGFLWRFGSGWSRFPYAT